MATPLHTETNLICTLNAPLGSTDASCSCTCVDRVTNLPRVPLATTKHWVLDKGTTNLPNINYEIVMGTPVTVGGVTTITFDPNGRKLAMSGTSLTGNAVSDPTNPTHIAGAEIGTVETHYLSTILAGLLDGTDSIDSNLNFGGVPTYNGVGIWRDRVFANAAARNAAIVAPQNGESCYCTAEGQAYDYIGGSWQARSSGVNPNAAPGTAGKVEIATQAENDAGTAVGGTGAFLTATPDKNAKSVQDSKWVFASSATGTDSYAITITPAISGYATGQKFRFLTDVPNTGASSLNVNGKGAVAIKKFHDQDTETGDIEAGQVVEVVYDGTFFQMQSQTSGSGFYRLIGIIQGTRDLNGVNAVVNYPHGMGVAPKYIEVVAMCASSADGAQKDVSTSIGFSDFSTDKCTWHGNNANAPALNSSFVAYLKAYDGTATWFVEQKCTATADSTNVTFSWAYSATATPPTGTIYFTIKCIA